MLFLDLPHSKLLNVRNLFGSYVVRMASKSSGVEVAERRRNGKRYVVNTSIPQVVNDAARHAEPLPPTLLLVFFQHAIEQHADLQVAAVSTR